LKKPATTCFSHFSLLGDRLMPALPQRLLDLLQLCHHAVPAGSPLEEEPALSGFPADQCKAEEVEGFRLSKPALGAFDRDLATKLD
jgi:hypothetical protein